jgi:hypothetical protein
MTDRYTKAVLTIIAIFLGVIAIQNFGATPAIAQGQNAPVRVQICGSNGYCAYVGNDEKLWVGP